MATTVRAATTAAGVGSTTTTTATVESAATSAAVRATTSASGGARCRVATRRGTTAARSRVRRAGRIRTRRRVVSVRGCVVAAWCGVIPVGR